MKVKTIKPHANGYGAKFEKADGDEYEIPDASAKTLIDEGLIEEVKGEAPAKGGKAKSDGDGAANG